MTNSIKYIRGLFYWLYIKKKKKLINYTQYNNMQ